MKKILFFLLIIVLLFISFYYDNQIFSFIEQIRHPGLNPIMIWSTTAGLILAAAIFMAILLKKKAFNQLSLIVLNAACAVELGYIIKLFLQVPRPYDVGKIIPLTFSSGYAFPSMHSAFVFSILPVIETEFRKRYYILWFIFALFIGFSRIYVGVHDLSDIIGGALLGYGIGSIFCYLEKEFKFIEYFYKQIHDKLELRRQFAHAFTGLSIIVLYSLGYLNNFILGIIVVLGGLASLISKYYEVPILSRILDYFERGHKRYTFPGQGSFCLVLGSFLALMLFPPKIAFAGITVMALGDSVTNIAGGYFGSIKNPLNPKKNIEGTIAAIIIATLGAWYFVPLKFAFMSSLVAMLLESIDLKIFRQEIDDNILIPLIVGEVLLMLGL